MLDWITADHEPVVITCDGGKPAAVLLSHENFAPYEETHYLLQSPRNADRLLRAVNDLEAREGVERQLDE